MRAYAGAWEHEEIERLANPARARRRQLQRQLTLSLSAPALPDEQHHAGCGQFHDSHGYGDFAMSVNATRARRREERRQINPGPCCDDCAQSLPGDVPCDRNDCGCESCAQTELSLDWSMAPSERAALDELQAVGAPQRISESKREFFASIAPEFAEAIPLLPDVYATRGYTWDEWVAKQKYSYLDCKLSCKQDYVPYLRYMRCCPDINGIYNCVNTTFNDEYCGASCKPCGVNQKCFFNWCFNKCPCAHDEYCSANGICIKSDPCTSDADCAKLNSKGPLNCCPLTGTNRHCVDLDNQYHCGGCEPPSCANWLTIAPPYYEYCISAGCCIGPGNLHFSAYTWKPNFLMQTNQIFCQCRDPLDHAWVMTYDPGGPVDCPCKLVGESCGGHPECCTYRCTDGKCEDPTVIPFHPP